MRTLIPFASPFHPLLLFFSLSLSFSRVPLYIFAEWVRNIISAHTRMLSRDRGSTERIARECLVVLKIAEDERASSGTLHRVHILFRCVVPSSSRGTIGRNARQIISGRTGQGGTGMRSTDGGRRGRARQAEITVEGTRRGWMNKQNEREREKEREKEGENAEWSRTLRNEIHPRW